MPPNQLNGIASFTPGTVLIFWRWAIGITNPRDTACRDTSRSGLASSVPRSNSVKMVARLMIRKSETTRLEIVSSVRLLFRRMFLKTSFAYFIRSSPSFRTTGQRCGRMSDTHAPLKGSGIVSHKRHKKHKSCEGPLCFCAFCGKRSGLWLMRAQLVAVEILFLEEPYCHYAILLQTAVEFAAVDSERGRGSHLVSTKLL